jgi:pimeloyl-ACP methyl ester carboxylesterase
MKREFTEIDLPVGYYDFHPVTHINFQINRWFTSGGYDFETAKEAGKQIKDFDDWVRVWSKLGKNNEENGKKRKAAFCFRAAEFFTAPKHPDKTKLYKKFIKLFYEVHKNEPLELFEIPYKTGELHTLKATPLNSKATLVMHGGGDSFIEEFYPYMVEFYNRGYEVILFEGPGQGSVIHKHGLIFEWQWEHCTKTILDYFNIKECALMGISMGGWLSIRAAGAEHRITKLIPFTALSNIRKSFLMAMPEQARAIYLDMMDNNKVNEFISFKAKLASVDSFNAWMDNNTIFTFKAKNIFEGYKNWCDYVPENQDIENIRADVLLTNCVDDHFVLLEDMDLIEKRLINAKSIEKKTFCREEHASHHCCIGNQKLVLNYIGDWLDRKCL